MFRQVGRKHLTVFSARLFPAGEGRKGFSVEPPIQAEPCGIRAALHGGSIEEGQGIKREGRFEKLERA